MINFKYLTSGNEERIYNYLNNLSTCQGCLCSKVYIRFLHALSEAPTVDVYVNGIMIISDLAFGEISDYILYYQDNYEITVYAHKDTSSPLIRKSVELIKNTAYTLAIAGNLDSYDIYMIKEYKREVPPILETVIAYTNLIPNEKTVNLYLSDDTLLFRGVEFTETMPDIAIVPTNESFSIRYSGDNMILATTPTIQLQKNTYYSIYSIGEDENIQLIIAQMGLNYLDLC